MRAASGQVSPQGVPEKSVHKLLWTASRAPTFKKFFAIFKEMWRVNPSVGFFLCPPLARYFDSLRASGRTGDPVPTDIVKRQVIAHSLNKSPSLMPTMEEMKSLASQCYGVTEDESSEQTPFDLYIALCALIEADKPEDGAAATVEAEEVGKGAETFAGPTDSASAEDDEEATVEEEEGTAEGAPVLEVTGEGIVHTHTHTLTCFLL
jgi:hypothetical protein